jgi:exopolyphosphatase/guanosine-5'-triphosphate,3'-diphosphate pyrophosphatase
MFERNTGFYQSYRVNTCTLKMNNKTFKDVCGVIDITSSSIKMGIYQKKKNEVIQIDNLDYPVTLGHEIYNEGQLSFESIGDLSRILARFQTVLHTYGTGSVRLISSSPMRDCNNKAIVSDRIKTFNDLNLEILSEDSEKSIIYYEIINSLSPKYLNGKMLISYIGTGSIGMAEVDNGMISSTSNIPFGSIKLNDILGSLHNEATDYHIVVDEYINSIFSKIDFLHKKFSSIILTGTELNTISEICGSTVGPDKIRTIPPENITKMYNSINLLSQEGIASRFNCSEESAGVIYTALSIYNAIIQMSVNSASFISPVADLKLSIARRQLIPGMMKNYRSFLYNNAINCAIHIADRFGCNKRHYTSSRTNSVTIFNKAKKIHGLSEDKCKLLEIAAILHDCGSFINQLQTSNSTYDILKCIDIFGITNDELVEIAHIGSCTDYNSLRSIHDQKDSKLIEIGKLAAIFQLANSLDISEKGKISIDKIKLEDDFLTIKAVSKVNSSFEKFSFSESSTFFKDIFGIEPQLTVKTLY